MFMALYIDRGRVCEIKSEHLFLHLKCPDHANQVQLEHT